jgi:hypothetical protein
MMKETLRIKMGEILTSNKTKERKMILLSKLFDKFTAIRYRNYPRKKDEFSNTLRSKCGGVSHRYN